MACNMKLLFNSRIFHLMLTDCGNWNYREQKQGLTTTFGIFEFQHWDAEANLVLSNKYAHKRRTVWLFTMLFRGCDTSLDYLCQNHLGRFSKAYAAELESLRINQRFTISLVTQESFMSILVSKLLWRGRIILWGDRLFSWYISRHCYLQENWTRPNLLMFHPGRWRGSSVRIYQLLGERFTFLLLRCCHPKASPALVSSPCHTLL